MNAHLPRRGPDFEYLDDASTSFPKAPNVDRAMVAALDYGNPGRSDHRSALSGEDLTSQVRTQVTHEFGVPSSGSVVFTSGATMSLNLAIKGILRRGDHIITTSFEHNSVLRPLKEAERSQGCKVSIVKCSDPARLTGLISRELRPNTRLIAATHASNVTGALLPINEIARIAHKGKALFLVDSAKSVGHLKVSLAELEADFVAFGAHKGLRGPPGIGVLMVANTSSLNLEPLVHGGTGLHSDQLLPPVEFPYAYEAGTPNLPAIAGLEAALAFFTSSVSREEERTAQMLREDAVTKLSALRKVSLFASDSSSAVPLFSFTIRNCNSARIAEALDRRYSLQVRGGLHCAPLMHESMGTQVTGAVRVSFGPGNTYETVDRLVTSVSELIMRGVD